MSLPPDRSRERGSVNTAGNACNFAVLAAHVATFLPLSCRILPPLPPITRNVKLPDRANRLEFGMREEDAPGTQVKSGKNGNVDHPSQLCRPSVDGGDAVDGA